MIPTGIPRIDQLLVGGGPALAAGEPDRGAVGVVQDLLLGFGFTTLPGVLAPDRGIFGAKTTAAVRSFQQSAALPPSGSVDQATLSGLVTRPASRPAASQGYLCLVLGIGFGGVTRLVSLTSQFEGAGLFAAVNRNTDRAGLSFGLIQWAQKPGRLSEVLRAFQQREPAAFAATLGDGDPTLAARLVQHTSRPNGGVDAQGNTVDPAFDLVRDPWLTRFRNAALQPALQKAQVSAASGAFAASLQKVHAYAPQLVSERAAAFMLDLANQHGDVGARSIFTAVAQPGMREPELLLAMQKESVARVQKQFGPGAITSSTLNRRQAFRTTPLLSDQPLQS